MALTKRRCMEIKCYPKSNGLKDLLFRENYISRKPVYDFYKRKLSKIKMGGWKVLDFGCGNMAYKTIFRDADDYIGLDVETAKEYGFDKVRNVVYYNGRDIPMDDGIFDCVVSAQVFEHVEDIDYSLSEIHRVLCKGGIMIFSVPMAYPIHYDPYDFRRFTVYGIRKKLTDCGFSNIEIEGGNREVDSSRFLKIISMPVIFRKPYVMYANLCFFLWNCGVSKGINNFLRALIGKNRQTKDKLLRCPLNYLIICRKQK